MGPSSEFSKAHIFQSPDPYRSPPPSFEPYSFVISKLESGKANGWGHIGKILKISESGKGLFATEAYIFMSNVFNIWSLYFFISFIDTKFVLAAYKTEPCKKPPRLCRQGYACPQHHNNRDRRRSPMKYKYRFVQAAFFVLSYSVYVSARNSSRDFQADREGW